MKNQLVLIIDFGGQYSHLISRRVRDLGVYCEIVPYTTPTRAIAERKPIGVILTGGPNSVFEHGAPRVDQSLFETDIPVLGICYGAQLMAYTLGGIVAPAGTREYGQTQTEFFDSALFDGLDLGVTWMSHGVAIHEMPKGFRLTAKTVGCPVAAMERGHLYAVQFHPEVSHTKNGFQMLDNFLTNVCHAQKDWDMGGYAEKMIAEIRERADGKKVLLGLSGGVDSAVAAALFSRAVGENLLCIFVDHGLMRKGEGDEIERVFADWDLTLKRVNAADRFLARLKGVADPEEKRKIIGDEFRVVFEMAAAEAGGADFLAQGTIYPDVIESGAIPGSAVIKSHHNVGGLSDSLVFEGVIEPLRYLFKDEVRRLGLELGLPKSLVYRQPFPGPGLAIRIIGEITAEKCDILREADAIFRAELEADQVEAHQYFAVLTNQRSVGVMGDGRTYDYTLALRAVTTGDFMTADFARVPYDTLSRVCTRIVNEVGHINRIVYDVTTKPPATIEWE